MSGVIVIPGQDKKAVAKKLDSFWEIYEGARTIIMDDLDCEEENDPVEAERIIRRALSFIDSSGLRRNLYDGSEIIGGLTKELKND